MGLRRVIVVLMYHPPLSGNAQERLGVMRETSDGFVIAQKDLETATAPVRCVGYPTDRGDAVPYCRFRCAINRYWKKRKGGGGATVAAFSRAGVRLLLRRWIGEEAAIYRCLRGR